MKETTTIAMPPCFERWCKQFDDCWKNPPQKIGWCHRNWLFYYQFWAIKSDIWMDSQ